MFLGVFSYPLSCIRHERFISRKFFNTFLADEVMEGSWFTQHIKTLPKVHLHRSVHGRGGLIKVSIQTYINMLSISNSKKGPILVLS